MTEREDEDTNSDEEIDDIEEVDLTEVSEEELNGKVPYHPVDDEFLFCDDGLPDDVREYFSEMLSTCPGEIGDPFIPDNFEVGAVDSGDGEAKMEVMEGILVMIPLVSMKDTRISEAGIQMMILLKMMILQGVMTDIQMFLIALPDHPTGANSTTF